jgi:D-psicose/D-tagatose/L-ribulose 3-epimerase
MSFRFGAHIFLWVDRWNDSARLIERAAQLGLKALEIAVGDDVTIDLAAARRAAHDHEIELILSPGGEWPMAMDLSLDDPALAAAGVDWHRRWIDRAGELGAIAYTGAIYGHPGRVLKRIPPPDELPRVAAHLRTLAAFAAERNVELVIEPKSHFRTHLINTPEQAMRLIELAGHPNLKVLLDTYHLVTEIRDYPAAVHTCGRRLWGIHACENDRGVPGGGLVPWAAICKALPETAARYIVFESYNSSIPGFAESRGMFHNVCPDGDAFVRQAMQFVLRHLS